MIDTDSKNLQTLRKNIFLAAYCSGVAHLAPAFSSVEILYTLYCKGILNVDAANPALPQRDRLILSKGHASLALYTTLAMAGFIEEAELFTFCQPGSRLGGEPKLGAIPGVEASTGSLGHGLSLGVGMALAQRTMYPGSKTYVVLGDGECQEGVIWEGVMSAARHGLDNLTVILDSNGLQKMGTIADTMAITEWRSRWASFGWDVQETDGHDVTALHAVLTQPCTPGKPRVILARTTKGKGVSFMENSAAWHFKMPCEKELRIIMNELNLTEEELAQCKKPI